MAEKHATTEQIVTHLLIISEDMGRSNRLISNLRNAGLSLRTNCVNTPHDLSAQLTMVQWDVLVTDNSTGIDLDSILALLEKHEQDIPVIVNLETDFPDANLVGMYNKGVADIVSADTPNRLIVSILREARQYALQKQLRLLDISNRELNTRLQHLLQDSPVAISYVRDGIHLHCNKSYADIFGYQDIKTISTTPLLNLIAVADRADIKSLLGKASHGVEHSTVHALCADGTVKELLFTFTPVVYQGKPCLQMTVQHPKGNDAFTAEMARLSDQDLLTRLDNKERFIGRIEKAIRDAIQQQQFSSLILVEIKDFPEISAALGKSNSNLLLNDVAAYLQGIIKQPFTAGRMQEHVFGIMLQEGDPDQVLALCHTLKQGINHQISSAIPSSLEFSSAIGMTLINGHALNAQDVLTRARLNLEQAIAGEAAHRAFRIGDSLSPDNGDMLEYLEKALHKERFKLVYQPIVGISGNNQQFYEVLIRMLDEDDNEILPGAFLPMATMNGMGEKLDRMVVLMALKALQKSTEVQRLTVNITNNTLMSSTFLPWLSEQLQNSRIESDRLGIDISEISVHNTLEAATEFCRGLEVLGVKLTISNFGCAVEPFAILEQLQPDFVTLDETVVRDLIYSSQQKANVQSIVKALHSRKLLVVTPRVEDMAVLPVLWELGVDYVQGYCVQAPSNEMNYEFVQDEEITLTAPSH